ncbi:hypothetical protein BGX28_008987 [Mortierella sp. GBA30]|nr:hypothetical protein BGX28_008987 [Mortierella sp. GBA30]
MPGSRPVAILDLPPEIFEVIISHLSRKDRAVCVRVSRTWLHSFLPHMWMHLQILHSKNHDKLNNTEFIMALIKNAHRVKTLYTNSIQWIWVLTALTKKCRNLRSIAYVRKPEVDGHAPALARLRYEDLDLSSTRKHLTLSAALPVLLRQNKRLRSINIDGFIFHRTAGSRTMGYILESCLRSTLERLVINFEDYQVERSPAEFVPSEVLEEIKGDWTENGPTAVRELVLSGEISDMDSLISLLIRCPRLESLILKNLKNVHYDSISTFLREFCPDLKKLQWDGNSDTKDDIIAQLLKSSNSWTAIKLPRLKNFGPKATEVLNDGIMALEVLSGGGCGKLFSAEFQALLCSAARLQSLNEHVGFARDSNVADVVLDARHILNSKSSWACSESLKYLRLVIDGIPRVDVKCCYNGEPFTYPLPHIPAASDIPSIPIQESVYRQLGAMIHLRTLVLGHPSDPSGRTAHGRFSGRHSAAMAHRGHEYQYQCLELSLRSGLGLLSGLKELRILDVSRMAHRIGVAELEWMHVSWPKLKTILGLNSKRLWEDHGGGSWQCSEDVSRWVKAHACGIGSSYYA